MLATRSWLCVLTIAALTISESSQGLADGYAILEDVNDDFEEKHFDREKRQTSLNESDVISVEHPFNTTENADVFTQDRSILDVANGTNERFLKPNTRIQNAVHSHNDSDHENKTQTTRLKSTRRAFIKLGVLTQPKNRKKILRGGKIHHRKTTSTAITTKQNYKRRMKTPSMKPLSLHAALLGLVAVMAVVLLVGILRHYVRQRGLSKYIREVHPEVIKSRKLRHSRRSLGRDRKHSSDHNWVWSMSTIHEHEDEDLAEQSSSLTANVSNFHQPHNLQLPIITLQERGEETFRANVLEEQEEFRDSERSEHHLEHEVSNRFIERAYTDRNIPNANRINGQSEIACLPLAISSPILTPSSITHCSLSPQPPFSAYYDSGNESSTDCLQRQYSSATGDNTLTPRAFHTIPNGFGPNESSIVRGENGLDQRVSENTEDCHQGNSERHNCPQISPSTESDQRSHYSPPISDVRSRYDCVTQENTCDQVDPSHLLSLFSTRLVENEPCPSSTENHDSRQSYQLNQQGTTQILSLHNTLPNTFHKPSSHGRHRRHRERNRMRDHFSRTHTHQTTNEPMFPRNLRCTEGTRETVPQAISNTTRSRSLSPRAVGCPTDLPEYSDEPLVAPMGDVPLWSPETERSGQPSPISNPSSVLSAPPTGDLHQGQVLVQQLSNGAQLIYIPAPPLPEYGEESPPPYQQ